MTEALKILPCPHCGGDSLLNSNYNGRYRQYFVYVKCNICGAQGKAFTDPNDPDINGWNDPACDSAIKAWNMRTKQEDD